MKFVPYQLSCAAIFMAVQQYAYLNVKWCNIMNVLKGFKNILGLGLPVEDNSNAHDTGAFIKM